MRTIHAGLLAFSLSLSALSATAQTLEVKRYNPSEWTKGRFTEIVTVNGPGKTIYLAGIGAEDETAPAGASAPIRHLGNAYEQCKYAYDKIKRALASQGATMADVVKQVVYGQVQAGNLRGHVDSGEYISGDQRTCHSGDAARGGYHCGCSEIGLSHVQRIALLVHFRLVCLEMFSFRATGI